MMTTKLDRIANKARTDRTCCFTSLAHLLTVDFLMETWKQMNRKGSSGVDGESTEEFAKNLRQRCEDLVGRLQRRQYQAPPVRRVEIPKADGKTRPLGIPTVEDRLLQRAVARILEAIYEAEFLPFSFGFRPGKSPHLALRELRNHLMGGRVFWVFETDIRGFFNHLNHKWLMKMLRVKIKDSVILRLIGKWLRAGALCDGILVRSEEGSPQGGTISPCLANVYLHYVIDLWFEKRVKRGCEGMTHIVRFADDFVAGFQRYPEAKRFAMAVKERLGQFGLEVAEEKTRLMAFGRSTKVRPGEKPSFDFLGFRHFGSTDRRGRFKIVRIPTTKSCRKFLNNVNEWLNRYRHASRRTQQRNLVMKLRGFFQYFGLTDCCPKLNMVRYRVVKMWRRALKKQSQRGGVSWAKMNALEVFQLPSPRTVHPTI